jgi:hypothetical protein
LKSDNGLVLNQWLLSILMSIALMNFTVSCGTPTKDMTRTMFLVYITALPEEELGFAIDKDGNFGYRFTIDNNEHLAVLEKLKGLK